MKRRGLLLAVAAVTLAIFCVVWSSHELVAQRQTDAAENKVRARPPEHRAPRMSRPLNVSVGDEPIDVSDVVARTHAAFHEHPTSPGVIVGGDVTYGVRVENGAISIHPEQWTHLGDETANRIGSKLTMHTMFAGRRGALPLDGPHYVIATDDGAIEAQISDGVHERVTNSASGMEQDWTFDRKPSGTGDLAVRVAVSGEQFAGITENGAHFRDPSSGLGLSYSHAQWIDAAGTITTVPVRYVDGTLALTVPEMVLEETTYPAVLDPTVGAEYAVDSPITVPANEEQSGLDIGHSGASGYDFLVVWQDKRRVTDTDLNYDVFGVHVGKVSGVWTVREPKGFVLNNLVDQPGNQTSPRARWLVEAQKYVVLWSTDCLSTSHSACPDPSKTVTWRTISSTSTTPDADPPGGPGAIAKFSNPSTTDATQPDVTSNIFLGSPSFDRMLIAFKETPVGGGTAHVVIEEWDNSSGTFTNTGPATDTWSSGGCAAATSAAPPRVAQDVRTDTSARFIVDWGGTYVLWGWNGPLYNLTGYGGSCGSIPAGVSGKVVDYPAVAPWGQFSNNMWLVAFHENDGTSLHPNFNIYAKGINFDGSLGNGIAVSTASLQQENPAVAGFHSSNSQVFVSWTDGRSSTGPTRAYGARLNIDGSGNITLYDGPSSTGGVNMVGVLYVGTSQTATHSDESAAYFAVWNDFRNSSTYPDLYGINVPFTTAANGSFTISSSYILAQSANKETAPSIAQCGGKYLVAWTDSRNEASTGKDIYGSVLNSDGTVAVSGIKISGANGVQDHPAVGCQASTGFYVVWEDYRNGSDFDIYGIGVGFDGSVSDPINGQAIATTAASSEDHPSIVAGLVNGSAGYLVVLEADATYVEGVMINTSGTVVVPEFFITPKGSPPGCTPTSTSTERTILLCFRRRERPPRFMVNR